MSNNNKVFLLGVAMTCSMFCAWWVVGQTLNPVEPNTDCTWQFEFEPLAASAGGDHSGTIAAWGSDGYLVGCGELYRVEVTEERGAIGYRVELYELELPSSTSNNEHKVIRFDHESTTD